MAINNPYVPGDPYSYDLKWIVRKIKEHETILTTLDQKIMDMIIQLLDQHDPIYWPTAADLIASDMKTPSLAYIEGFYAPGDGGANLYYITSDYNDVLAANFYITLDGANRWAIPIIVGNYVTPLMFGAHADGSEDASEAIRTALKYDGDVFFPMNKGEIYVIASTVDVEDKTNRQLYSNITVRQDTLATFGCGYITGTASPFFDVKSGGVRFYDLSFREDSGRTLTAIRFNNIEYGDTDGVISGCGFYGFGKVAEYDGRSLTFVNNLINYCDTVLDMKFTSSGGTVLQDQRHGNRGHRISENRLHAITTGVKFSGTAISGALISNNVLDVGGKLFDATGIVDGCEIIDNVVLNCRSWVSAVVSVSGTLINSMISGNNISGDATGDSILSRGIVISGEMTDSTISSNSITRLSNDGIQIPAEIDGCIITGNIITGMENTAGDYLAPLRLGTAGGNVKNTIIAGNVLRKGSTSVSNWAVRFYNSSTIVSGCKIDNMTIGFTYAVSSFTEGDDANSFHFPYGTTTQRATLHQTHQGMLYFNTTTNALESVNSSNAWYNV